MEFSFIISIFLQYISSYFLLLYLYSNFAIYLFENSLLNVFLSSLAICYLISFFSYLYSFSNSFTRSIVFFKFSAFPSIFFCYVSLLSHQILIFFLDLLFIHYSFYFLLFFSLDHY